MQTEIRWCAGCVDDRVFEQPECEDGHGELCLDLSCVECGFAIVLGHVEVDEPVLIGALAA